MMHEDFNPSRKDVPEMSVPLPSPACEETVSLKKDALSARLLGAHMPTAGGLCKALLTGKEIGCTAVQLFTGSPRQWSHPPLKDADVAAYYAAREATGIDFVVAHDSYLINLASPAADVLERSRDAFRGELDRAQTLDIPWVVTHMGAHLDQGEEVAVERLIESLKQILETTDAAGYHVGVALETTAGQGTGLGWRFEQIGQILAAFGGHPRLGVCLDTCHVFVAGYDLRTLEAYAKTMSDFQASIGFEKLKVIHANDAKRPLGSRVDRHDHIGDGEIGIEAFARLVTDPRLLHIPVMIETPDSETMHAVNLARLRRLASEGALGMLVTVHFFGHYSDYYEGKPLEVTLPVGATILSLSTLLAERDARLKELERHCRFAVDEEYAGLDTILREGAAVAVLPPMSGG
jgi:deoxyribonuclease-4